MVFLLSILGCSQDFGLAGVQKPQDTPEDEDTAVEPIVDTAEEADSAAPPDEEETADTEMPPEDTAEETPDTDVPDDPPPADDCTDTADLVYVLSRDDSTLYTFDPDALAFTSLGRVSCGTSETPGSMAVSRDGVAYVRYADNSVYALDLATMRCSATSYADRRFDSFGMGYATDSSDTWRDQLYVANATSVGILDPSTWTITPLGRMASQSELTGNADGELWAILPLESPAELVKLDTTTGATVETIRMPGFPDPGDIDTFAFATWSGDFYVFVREYGMGSSTDVIKVTRMGGMTTVLEDVGFDVVGAGVSTCAPG
jgi:hypothetical protein